MRMHIHHCIHLELQSAQIMHVHFCIYVSFTNETFKRMNMKLLDHFKCTCNWLRCEANRSTLCPNLRMRMFRRSFYAALVLFGFYYVDLVLFYATDANACICMKMYHRISLSSFNREFIYMQFSEFTAS